MARIPAPEDQWYVVHVLSGQENKVRDSLERRKISEELSDIVFEVLVPTEIVQEVRAGEKRERKRKFFPGYILVNLHLLTDENRLVDRAWYFIQDTPSVINIVGPKDHPVPMPEREVQSMLAQIKEREGTIMPAALFEVGDAVVVADGPFEGQSGVIAEVNEEKGELMVAVSIFGRETQVPLEYWQVEKA